MRTLILGILDVAITSLSFRNLKLDRMMNNEFQWSISIRRKYTQVIETWDKIDQAQNSLVTYTADSKKINMLVSIKIYFQIMESFCWKR